MFLDTIAEVPDPRKGSIHKSPLSVGGYLNLRNTPISKKMTEGEYLMVSGEREMKLDKDSSTRTISHKIYVGDIDFGRIEATVGDGLLTLFIPDMKKKKKKKISTNIEIA